MYFPLGIVMGMALDVRELDVRWSPVMQAAAATVNPGHSGPWQPLVSFPCSDVDSRCNWMTRRGKWA